MKQVRFPGLRGKGVFLTDMGRRHRGVFRLLRDGQRPTRPGIHHRAFGGPPGYYLRVGHHALAQFAGDKKSAPRLKVLEGDVELVRHTRKKKNGAAAGIAQAFRLEPAGDGLLERGVEGKKTGAAGMGNAGLPRRVPGRRHIAVIDPDRASTIYRNQFSLNS